MKRYLVKENAEKAQANIQNVEDNFVKPLATLANAINGLGLEVNKENLYDAIANNGDGLMQLFNDARNNYGEMDARLAVVAEEVDNKKILAFTKALLPFKGSTTIYNNMSIGNPELLCCIGIENGGVYLLDSTKEEIIENAKEYCNTKSGRDLFDLHQKIAKELQILYDGINAIRNEPGQSVSFEAGFAMLHFPKGLFDMHNNEDGDLLIKPRNINFDPVVEDDEDFNLNDDSDEDINN